MQCGRPGIRDPDTQVHCAALRVVAIGTPPHHSVWTERHGEDISRREARRVLGAKVSEVKLVTTTSTSHHTSAAIYEHY